MQITQEQTTSQSANAESDWRATIIALPLSVRILTGLGVITAIAMSITIYNIFIAAPVDSTGQAFRIFYFHVPVAWACYLAFFVVFVASIMYLWRRDERWDWLARGAAEVGTMFATLALITGSIWGRTTWNSWWNWSEPRLTTTLILWFVYVGYLMLRSYTGRTTSGARMAAVLGVVGFASVPIDYFSVVWWANIYNTHPSVNYVQSAGLPGNAVAILMVSLTTFTLVFVFLTTVAYHLQQVQTGAARLRGRLEADA